MINGVYLAYPIDQRPTIGLQHLFDQIEGFKTDLIEQKATSFVFDPGDAFRVQEHAEGMTGVAQINRHALVLAECLVAFLPEGVATVGVPMEIDRARAMGKHVIVISDTKSWMLDLPGVFRYQSWDDTTLASIVHMIGQLNAPEAEWTNRNDALPVKFLSGSGDAVALPVRHYLDDAGLDLTVDKPTVVPANTFTDIPCGIAVELPPWTWGLVTGRSSSLRKRGLLVHTGVIDPGYRGELYAGAWNMTDEDVKVEAGDRIAQFIIMGNTTRRFDPIQVLDLDDSPRGVRGFGSTGV